MFLNFCNVAKASRTMFINFCNVANVLNVKCFKNRTAANVNTPAGQKICPPATWIPQPQKQNRNNATIEKRAENRDRNASTHNDAHL
jgi:hypothetical protein